MCRVAGLVLHRGRRSGPRRGDLRRRLPFRMPCRYRRHLRGAHRGPRRASRLLRPDGGRLELRPDLLLPARVHRAGGRAAVRGRGRFPRPVRRGARDRGFRRHARSHVGARRGRRREGVDLRLRLLLVRDRRARFQPRAGALPRRDRGRLGCRAERSRRSSTTPLPSSSAASARISSTRSRTRSSVSPSWQPCLSMRSWTPASR